MHGSGGFLKHLQKIHPRKLCNRHVITSYSIHYTKLYDRDVRQSWASPATSLSVHELNYLLTQLTVEHIMVKKIITISPGTTIERAAYIMQQNRINALPVIEAEKLVGIITRNNFV